MRSDILLRFLHRNACTFFIKHRYNNHYNHHNYFAKGQMQKDRIRCYNRGFIYHSVCNNITMPRFKQ